MPNTYTLLETITVGAAGASSVTFNSIPQTGYTDLVIKVSARTAYTAGSYGDGLNISFNSSTTGYTYRQLQGYDSTAASASGSTQLTGLIPDDAAAQTVNVFSNNEIYIPNYRSANNKSYSVDNVVEKNGTTNWVLSMFAGLWSNTAAITSIGLTSSNASTFKQYSTFSLYGVSALGVTPTRAPKATGGSIIQTDGTYWYHAFLATGEFKPATALSCDVLVVAGGGGGGGSNSGSGLGGGGGSGGAFYATNQTLSSAQTVTVGAGGAGAATNIQGTNGSNSVFGSLTNGIGGGGGGGFALTLKSGLSGGSGGGGATFSGDGTAGATTQTGTGGTGYGFAGGTGYEAGVAGAGGGGIGAVGVTPTTSAGGTGGAGLNTWSTWLSPTGLGISGYIGGGGGGGARNSGAQSNGGSGGGGKGTYFGVGTDQNAIANTGSGGGGGSNNGGTGAIAAGGNGGSGLVIIRYLA